jgi:hypothetical protein
MSEHSTANDVKREHIEKLGDNLGPLFHELWNEVAWLYIKWEEYVELFGKTPSRIDLLNQSAPMFFRIVQDSLLENVLLNIARLTDLPKYLGNKSNISIQCLSGLVDKEVQETISYQITDAIKKTDFCRDWRNRYIAHRDFKLVMSENAEPLKPASRAKVREALESIANVLNTISEYYMKKPTIGLNPIKRSNGAEYLLYIIDDGIKASADRQKRRKSGKYLPEDLVQRRL